MAMNAGMDEQTGVAVEDAKSDLRPFYFMVVYWGDRFASYLLDMCIPALLSPGNAPALDRRRGSKFLIATTREDWDKLQDVPIYLRMKEHLEPVWLEIPLPAAGISGCQHMGIGHTMATNLCHRDKAYGIALTPDLVLSDGTVRRLQELAAEGYQVVLTAALRFGEEPLYEGLTKLGLLDLVGKPSSRTGEPLVFSSRDLVRVGLESFHSETRTYEWDADWFTNFPVACWWRVPGEEGIVLHCFSWAPLLLDYGMVVEHDTTALEHWTMDGDYVVKNFFQAKKDGRMYIVQDSDEMMVMSWSPLNDRPHPLKKGGLKGSAFFGTYIKGSLLRNAYFSDIYDPLKREIFPSVVRWHARDLNDAWRPLERKALQLIAYYISTGLEEREKLLMDQACPRVRIPIIPVDLLARVQERSGELMLHEVPGFVFRMRMGITNFWLKGILGVARRFGAVFRFLATWMVATPYLCRRGFILTYRTMKGDPEASNRLRVRLAQLSFGLLFSSSRHQQIAPAQSETSDGGRE